MSVKKQHQTDRQAEKAPERETQQRTKTGLRLPILPVWAVALLMVITALGMGVISMYFGSGNYRMPLFLWLLQKPVLLLLNSLPFLLVCLLVWLLTDRAWIGATGGGLLCMAYSLAEYWKLMARGEPVYAEDIVLFREAAGMANRYIFFTPAMALSLFAILLAAVCFALLGRKRLKHFPLRLVLCLALLAVAAGLYTQVYLDNDYYNSFAVYEDMNPNVAGDRYLSTGSLYPFIRTIPAALHGKPEGYRKEDAKATLSACEDSDIPEKRKVSVVCVMMESMADLSKCTDLITENDPYVKCHQLEAESYCGRLVTNVFQGGTVDTERSVLTGFRRLGSFRTASWSYARYFDAQGYLVMGGHAGNADFYNRELTNRNLGFADYHFIENYYVTLTDDIPWDGVFFSDVTQTVLYGLNFGPVFSYSVSYQNHGPYPEDECMFDTEYLPRGVTDDATYYIVNNYLVGVESTWNCVMNMVDAFSASDEPIVLVLFGDHKPWLGNQGGGYADLGIDISLQDEESFLNYYATDYIIWANPAAKQATGNDFVGEGPTISSCYLMNVLFEQCGWEGPAWKKLSDEVRATLPVISTTGRYLWENTLTDFYGLPEEQQALVRRMDNLSYYLEYEYMKDAS